MSPDLYMPIEGRREVIKSLAMTYGIRTFVETGTADGSTTEAMVPYFDKLYTVEIDPGMWAAACDKFTSTDGKVTCLLGDSGQVLYSILPLLEEPAIFWLDGHYCGGPTRGDDDSPVIEELVAAVHAPRGSVILVDDARLFGGGPAEGGDNGEGYTGYPLLSWVEEIAGMYNFNYWLENDIIRLTPSVQDH